MTDKYYSKKQPSKIQLSFPKDFNRRLDDVLGKMSEDYQEVLQEQNATLQSKIERMYSDVKNMESYVHNIKCKNPDVVVKMAPILTSSIVVNVPEIIELLIDDMLTEEVINQNMLEEVDSENQTLIETKLKKNRVKSKLQSSTQYGVWHMIEKLEEYKNDIGCD